MFQKLLLLLLCLGLTSVTYAQDENLGAGDSISPQLQEQFNTMNAAAETLRQLPALESISLHFPTRDDLRAYLVSTLEEQLPPDVVIEQMQFYVAFGFLPADYQLLEGWLELYAQQVGGYYDTDDKTMNVILLSGNRPTTALPLLESITYVHEYVHALQDQHFDLDAYLEAIDPNTEGDAYLARIALVEGDASAIMNEFTRQVAEANPVGTLLQLGIGLSQAGNLTLPVGTPAIFEAELLFPYIQGEQFVRGVFQDSTWEAVNAVYSNPPQSTEQILHPEKYLSGEIGLVLSLADASSALGADWALVREGVFGEFYLQQYLKTELGQQSAQLGAGGWNGDYFHIYQAANGDLAYQLQIAFDSPSDMEELQPLMLMFGNLRYEVTEASLSEANGQCWSSATLPSLCLRYSEQHLFISHAPTLEQAQALLAE